MQIFLGDTGPMGVLDPCTFVFIADVDLGKAAELETVHRHELPDQVVFHVLTHALDDRDDGNEEHDADGHAQQREEALELLYSYLLQRQSKGLEPRHGSGDRWRGEAAAGCE